ADKADLEYLAHAINLFGNFYATGTLGSFSALSSFGYEWYRSAASTSAGHLHPVMRVLLDADGNLATTHDRGGLVYERVYNEAAGWAAATNSWVAESIGASTYLWSFGLGLPFAADINGNGYGYDATLADWQMYLPSAVIIGFSLGIGSGWGGDFLGAVDSARWTIGGITSAFNFEVRQAGTVPEPASGAVLAAAWIAGILVAKRRWRAA
ncbi:MAG: hypothetical protein N2483_08460, partial [Burkholderiaceae bacterium]|nr:hypothetical protein [Burkholderiaceae bacterium]